VLRRSRLDDGERIAVMVAANLDHVRPFMPWANQESASAVFQASRAVSVMRNWDAGTDFEYLAIDQDSVHLGNFGVHRRIGPDAIEIGYWLTREAQGHGYATRAAHALTEAALALDDVRRVEIHCDVANVRSARIPDRLGYRMDRIIDWPKAAPAETGRHMIWVYPGESAIQR
jgi:RimJ/RimL family protein N-acetyltransferase